MHILRLSILALAGLSNASPGSLVDCLKPALSSNTALEYPDQEAFVQDTGRYSTLFAPNFSLVAKVTTEVCLAAAAGGGSRWRCLLTPSSLWERSVHVRFADGRPAGFGIPKLHVVPAAAQRLHLADIPGVS